MPNAFFKHVFTPDVLDVQKQLGSFEEYAQKSEADKNRNQLTSLEIGFIRERDEFYLASVASNGWPYIQYKGGPPGFVALRRGDELWFADYKGNRQYITQGNIVHDARVALFFIDHATRRRLKVLARLSVETQAPDLPSDDLENQGELEPAGRYFVAKVALFDWNCTAYITRRLPADDVEAIIARKDAQIAALEARLGEPGASAEA